MRDEPVEEAVFVAFDTETTGLIAGVDRLVEVAAVAFGRGRILAEHEQLVDPGIPIPPHVSAINKVTDGMVRGMPSIAQALPAFFEALGRGMPVAHNAGFDVGFLVPVAREAGLSTPDSPILDTRLLARAAFPGRYSYSLSNLTRDLSPPPLEGVGEAREAAGREEPAGARGGAHSALADARACASLFELCVRALADRGCRTVDDIVRIDGPRLGPRGQRAAASRGGGHARAGAPVARSRGDRVRERPRGAYRARDQASRLLRPGRHTRGVGVLHAARRGTHLQAGFDQGSADDGLRQAPC